MDWLTFLNMFKAGLVNIGLFLTMFKDNFFHPFCVNVGPLPTLSYTIWFYSTVSAIVLHVFKFNTVQHELHAIYAFLQTYSC